MEQENYPTVYIPQGMLRGQKVTRNGEKSFFSFQGIPYAKPPVGPRRFKVAEPPEPWQGVRDSLMEGSSCPQIEWLFKRKYRGDEDCLYLNVYTPELSSFSKQVKKPVMVWIHGGGFQCGSADADYYGPEYILDEDVVLVTINYRVGIFGFLSLDDALQPDNLGLKDQVAALRWVRANIVMFGGDPNNVTIFGESAGGASVHCHMLSSMSKGLFHKAIMQSGCAMNPWTLGKNPKELAFQVARKLGCKTNDTQELLEFLTNASAQELVETLDKFRLEEGVLFVSTFGPVPERYVKPGEEIFLPATPNELMEKGQFHSVPCMVGMTSQESILFLEVFGISKNPKMLELFGENMETQIPTDLVSSLKPSDVAREIKKFYFKNKNLTINSIDEYLNLATDTWFSRGVDKTIRILSSGPFPVFYYNFAFCGQRNVFKYFTKNTTLKGASHFDEIGYLFKTPFFKLPEAETNSREWITLKRMTKMWTSFARTGNPTSSVDAVVNTRWPPFTVSNPVYLNIDDKLSVGWDMYKERMAFWNKL